MPIDITSIGTKIVLVDAVFPDGRTIVNAPQDGTFFSVSTTNFRNVMVGMNGHQVSHGVPNLIQFEISVIPNSPDDNVLSAIASYVRPQGVTANVDSIQVSVVQPNGKISVYGDFEMTDAPFDNTANSDGSYSTKTYSFSGTTKVA